MYWHTKWKHEQLIFTKSLGYFFSKSLGYFYLFSRLFFKMSRLVFLKSHGNFCRKIWIFFENTRQFSEYLTSQVGCIIIKKYRLFSKNITQLLRYLQKKSFKIFVKISQVLELT